MKIFIYLFTILFFSLNVKAQLEFKDHAMPELFTSARTMAMGNAALADDHGIFTVFSNPATMYPIRKHEFSLLNVSGQYNSQSYDATIGSSGISGSAIKKGQGFLSFTKMNEELVDNGGGALHQSLGLISYYRYKRLTLGYFSKLSSSGLLENETASLHASKRSDFGPFVSINTPIGRRLLFGLTYTYLSRKEGNVLRPQVLTPTQEEEIDDAVTSGVTNHFIMGFKYKLSDSPYTMLSLVNRNVTNDSFFFHDSHGRPNKIPNTTDLGLAYWTGAGKQWKYEMVFRDITGAYDVTRFRKLQLGVNLDFNRTFNIKAGVMESQPTFGVGWDIKKKVNLSFATYAVNVEEVEFTQTNRIFILEMAIR